MSKRLTVEQIRSFHDDGYIFPLSCMSREEAEACHRNIEDFERETRLSVNRDLHFKTHLYFSWSLALAQRPEILDAVEDLIGPDILVFASGFWAKAAGDRTFVSWHQDSAYFGLDPHDEVTAWIALTDSDPGNGCMRVLPRSHLAPAYDHVETTDDRNLLSRGQTIAELDASEAVDIELKAGEFSLHHEHAAHGSLPNGSDRARIGYSLMFIPAHVRSTIGRRTAWLVRGEDNHRHWDADPMPACDRDPAILQFMWDSYERYRDRRYKQEAESV